MLPVLQSYHPGVTQKPVSPVLTHKGKQPYFPRWIYVALIILMLLGGGTITALSIYAHNQDMLLTSCEEKINKFLTEENLRASHLHDPVREQAQIMVNDTLEQLDSTHKTSLVHFLAGTRLINGEQYVDPIIVFNDKDLKYVDFSGVDLYVAYFRGTDLRGADFRQAVSLQGADMQNANLQGAHVTLKQLQSLWKLQGAILPDGTLCSNWTNNPEPDKKLSNQNCLSHYHPQ
jgi:uncharacterized protein YjbI with pentapeptide repeats